MTYVASAPKSNAACMAVFDAMEAVKNTKTTVPSHLQDAHYKGSKKMGHGVGYLLCPRLSKPLCGAAVYAFGAFGKEILSPYREWI